MATQEQESLPEQTDRLFRAIGAIVVAFQLTELWVAEALAGALRMENGDDRDLVLAAMSYRQKVDLLFELYVRHADRAPQVNLPLAKRALTIAEEFRNRIVHSVWAVRGEPREWVRTKANLKGSGLTVRTKTVKIEYLESASRALLDIRAWELTDETELTGAIKLLESWETHA